MRKTRFLFLLASLCLLCIAKPSRAQSNTGGLDFVARITPTAARPEPVRQFTFYILTKSYAVIAKEVEDKDMLPTHDAFINDLSVSTELKAWLKDHDVFDLTVPDLDKILTPDDIIHVPEFLLAYQRSNSGGVTNGIPRPKYSDADKTANPPKYEKQHQDYLVSLKKFIQLHPETMSGVELELGGVNPQRKWAQIEGAHRKRVQRLAPEVAQTRYLASKIDTDLEGHAAISGLAPGNYWISSLNLEANAGDMHARWDVPFTIEAGQTARLELTNLNATDALAALNP